MAKGIKVKKREREKERKRIQRQLDIKDVAIHPPRLVLFVAHI
jgi:hypothetical protein